MALSLSLIGYCVSASPVIHRDRERTTSGKVMTSFISVFTLFQGIQLNSTPKPIK